VKDETIEQLVSLWESLEQERPHIRFPDWWKRRKPSKNEMPRLSIRTWNNRPDWYRMMNIYWMISSWMFQFSRVKTFLSTQYVIRDEALFAAWILGEYLEILHDADTRYFIERLQKLAYAIVVGIDEDEATKII
jgi:hypothetical protein